MDHEIDETEDYIPGKTYFVISPPVIPPWEKKKETTIWSPILKEYHNIIDNPGRLPSPLQPLLSKQRAFTFVGPENPSYLNIKLHVSDEYGVHRRLYLTLCQDNLIVGAVGAILVGFGTKHFNLSKGRFLSFVAQRLLLGKPMSALSKTVLSASLSTFSLCSKLITRAVTGGVMYDTIVRSREEKHMEQSKKLMNVGLAGGIVGLLFGLRGGLPTAWAAGILASTGAMGAQFVPIPRIFTTTEESILEQG